MEPKDKKAHACNDLICTQWHSEGEAIPASACVLEDREMVLSCVLRFVMFVRT